MHPRTDLLVDLAIEEDLGLGDVTSRAIFVAAHRSRAVIEARQDLVVCGLDVAARVFARVDPSLEAVPCARDGDRVSAGAAVMRLRGSTASLLAAERTALNFLQRLSGVATLARRFADAAAGSGVRIVDTRKTTPGYRDLEKYAVRCGGCRNHRGSLGEHLLVKDNHIAAAGSVALAVALARDAAPHLAKVEVEAGSLAEVREAVRAGADAILLDNMTPDQVRAALAVIGGSASVEISGGIRLETLRSYLIPGVDVISVGGLTHSAPAADLTLTIHARKGRRAPAGGSRRPRPADARRPD